MQTTQTSHSTSNMGSLFGNVFTDLVSDKKQVKPVDSDKKSTVVEVVVATTTTKQPKEIISHVIRFSEKQRIVTAKYEYNRTTKTLKYGATIFKRTGDKYDKHGHSQTAQKRFELNPIIVKNFIDTENDALFKHALRQQIHKHGVKSLKETMEYELTKEPTLKVKKEQVVSPAKASRISARGEQEEKKKNKPSVKKEMKPVVSRTVTVKETSGKFKRNILIKYEYNRDNKTLKYGAVISKMSLDNSVKYDRESHLKTAEKRFEKQPVTLENFTDEGSNRMFNEKIRAQLHKYGVKSKTQ